MKLSGGGGGCYGEKCCPSPRHEAESPQEGRTEGMPLQKSLLEPGRPGLWCLIIIAHNNPKWVTQQFCVMVLNGTLGECAC